jgi:galactokinase
MPGEWMFVIASSGVQADKAGSVLDRYNRASNGVRALHAIWNRRAADTAISLADAMASSDDAIERLKSWLPSSSDTTFSAADLERRLEHFVRETARAPRAARAFAAGDRDALSELSADSQREAADLLGNQIPETIAMAALARQVGAFASSSFGAGFGGSVWAVVPSADAAAFGEEWVRAYARRMPGAGTVPWFAARPGPAATEVSLR